MFATAAISTIPNVANGERFRKQKLPGSERSRSPLLHRDIIMSDATTMPAINAASIMSVLTESETTESLSMAAHAALSTLLISVHPNDWRENRPISRLSREDLARRLGGACLKTVQRALVELEQARLIDRLFNDVHHAIGVDLQPLVAIFHDLRRRAHQRREERKQERAERRAAKVRKKFFAEKEASSQMVTDGHSNTNPPLEDESSCTGLGNEVVAPSGSGTSGPRAFSGRSSEPGGFASESAPPFQSWRWAILTINPQFRSIAAANTDSGKANEASIDDLLHAAEVLRREIGYRRMDWEQALQRHGPARALAYFVTMTSPAAKHFRQIRNVQGYVRAGFDKPPEEFRPFQSMWAVLQEMKERGLNG